MWGWGACPGNILRFRPFEIEFESDFEQYITVLSTEYIVPFWIENWPPQDLMWAGIYYNNLKLIAYTFDCWEILKIRPSKIECYNNFKSLSQHYCPLNEYLSNCCIRGDCSIRSFFDNVQYLGPLTRWGPGQNAPVAPSPFLSAALQVCTWETVLTIVI